MSKEFSALRKNAPLLLSTWPLLLARVRSQDGATSLNTFLGDAPEQAAAASRAPTYGWARGLSCYGLGACRPQAGQASRDGRAAELALDLCSAGHALALLACCGAGVARRR